MKSAGRKTLLLLAALSAPRLVAQSSGQQGAAASTSASQAAQIERLSHALDAAEDRLKQSEQEIAALKAQIEALRATLKKTAASDAQNAPATIADAATAPASVATPSLQERVDVLEAEVKQHEQAKAGSASRYPINFTGLLLFNASSQSGAVDNVNDPTLAFPVTTGNASRRYVANFSQSILGLQVAGPHVLGASSSGEINFDFSGSPPYSSYGTSGGTVRLRTGAVQLTWLRDAVAASYSSPIISPLNPTSYATMAEPGMSWAGNLWIWSPQLAYTHHFGVVADRHVTVQAGLWDPPPAGSNNPNANRVTSPGERSAQPGYEMRLAMERGEESASDRAQLGLGGYYSRQSYTNRNGDSWALTTDWKLPFLHVLEWSGEAYRGRSLAGLGGTVFKDVINGTSPANGATTFRLLNGAGGWTQAKVRLMDVLETNAAFGIDTGFSRDFRSLTGTSPTQIARDQMVVWNFIYTPRSYIVLSPEYRFIRTGPISSPSSTAHVFTFTMGLKF